MIFLASSFMAFTWNSFPSVLINFFGFLFFLVFFVLKNRPIGMSKLFLMLFAAFFSLQILSSNILIADAVGGGFLWIFVLGILFLSDLSLRHTKAALLGVLWTVLSTAILDSYLRLSSLLSEPWLHLHVYKFGNIGIDTNYTGVMIVLVYVLVLISGDLLFSKKSRFFYLVVLIVLILFTFSRSAWAVTFLITFFYFTKGHPRLQIVISFLALLLLFVLVSGDESFSTKFSILSLVYNDFQSWTFIDFWVGKGGNVQLDGRSLHLLFLQLVYYSGFIGVVVAAILVFCLVKLNVRYTLCAFGLLGFSFVPFSSPLISISFLIESLIRRHSMGLR